MLPAQPNASGVDTRVSVLSPPRRNSATGDTIDATTIRTTDEPPASSGEAVLDIERELASYLEPPDTADTLLYALIARHPHIAENEPILVGTRIRVAILYAMESRAHMSVEEIARQYPHLSPYQIEGALQYARANRDEMERYLEQDDLADSER